MAYKNKADATEYKKRYCQLNKEKLSAAASLYYTTNKESIEKKNKAYEIKNVVKRKEQAKILYDAKKVIYTVYVKTSIQDIIALVLNKHSGAVVISTEFINTRTKLNFLCSKGHSFSMLFYDVKDGHWCPTCAGIAKPSIDNIRNIVEAKFSGALITSTYKNAGSVLTVSCSKGHVFETSWSAIRDGYWCMECSGSKIKTLDGIQEDLDSRHPGAILVDTVYKNNKTKLNLVCGHGHTFKMTWNDITHDYWCSKCSEGKSEAWCRQVFQKILTIPFDKHRIYYDSINKKKFYEIDGFNQGLKLGFEYQGRQHYEYVPKFHRGNETAYIQQQEFDKRKLEYLQGLGYHIVIIPHTVNFNNLKSFIEKEIETWQRLKVSL